MCPKIKRSLLLFAKGFFHLLFTLSYNVIIKKASIYIVCWLPSINLIVGGGSMSINDLIILVLDIAINNSLSVAVAFTAVLIVITFMFKD